MAIDLRHLSEIATETLPSPDKVDGNVYISTRLSLAKAVELKCQGYRVIYEDKDFPGRVDKWITL